MPSIITRTRRTLPALLIALVAGCSVPPTRHGRRVSEVKDKVRKAETALSKDETDSAQNRSVEAAKLAAKLGSEGKIMLGDPRRDDVDKALARARVVRKEVAETRTGTRSSGLDQFFEAEAAKALADAKAFTGEVNGPPEGVAGFSFDGGDTNPGTTPSGSGADLDSDVGRAIATGEAEGDISDAELAGRSKAAVEDKEKTDAIKVDAMTRPIVIKEAPITKGKGVVLYFFFVNKNADTFIGSVTGEFLRETGARCASILASYVAKDFEPNWNDIFESKGTNITAGQIYVRGMEAIRLVAVCEKPEVGRVEKAKVVITTTDGRTARGKGPE